MDHWNLADGGVVELPGGRRVRGTGLRRPRGEAPLPDFAVYLRGRDPLVPDREYRWVRWRDFRLPDSTEQALAALREAHTRAEVERVEIACGGGIGRTGTAMAVLAIMSGVAPDDAVAWVRANYHRRAVETRAQRRWIAEVSASALGSGHRPPG
jgi:hypothetical protein